MVDLLKMFNECIEEMDAIDIPYGNIIAIKPMESKTQAWGLCIREIDCFTIEINKALLNDDVDEFALKNTIVHEILHTIDGCFDHRAKWKMYADLVNDCYYNYNIQRTTAECEKGVTIGNHKYSFRCKNCGVIVHYNRNCKFVRNYKSLHYGCHNCNTFGCWEMI